MPMQSSSDVSVVRDGNGHRLLSASKSLQYHPDGDVPVGAITPQHRRQAQLMRHGETFDNGMQTKEGSVVSKPPLSRQMSISVESSDLFQAQSYRDRRNTIHSNYANNSQNNNNVSSQLNAIAAESSSSGSTAESDDMFAEEQSNLPNDDPLPSSVPNSRDSPHSSVSASSDSAIDKGEHPEASVREQELEKELINIKCELARAMNRQTCFQEILKKKDEIILDLDEKLSKFGDGDTTYDSKKRVHLPTSKESQERIRVLQNQNRFLNEEVRRLAKLRSQEQNKMKGLQSQVEQLTGNIELWKLQYVSLIQSSIRFTGSDTMDDAELSLYGGDRHKNKVKNLLDEGRKINPSLPTYENLSAGEVHVDYYGFKHQFHDTGLLLHYLCQELTQHYLAQAANAEEHQLRWDRYIKANGKSLLKDRKELKALCRGGIPDHHRKQVWRALIHHQVEDIMREKGPHYFRSLCSMLPDSPLAARYRKQIGLDLMRTMPSNVRFSTAGSKGIMDMQDVLLAFCIHNPNIGYCQGMNFLVAMALLFMDVHDAFWTLVAVTERYHSSSYFDHNLLGAQADQSVLRDLLADLLPDLARHLEAIDIEISTVTLNWFLAIFFDAVPFPTLLRVWDCFLLEGPKVLFRFSLAILKLHEREIVNKAETISVMRHLKACARVTYDVDGLVHLAFKGFKPFPRRQDISSKQMVYLKALKEKYRWRELQKLAFAERENLFMSLESESRTDLTFECATISNSGEVWACYGNPSQCKVCVVDCKEGTMTDLNVQISSRVMSLCAIPEALLFGTLSWSILCFREVSRTLVWEQRVHDAVLSVCQFMDDGACRVFAGLADGTVAVLENVAVEVKFYDVMYILIGQSPVTCVKLLGPQLWCACGNTVSVIHANTLDTMDNFTVSSNPYDHILSLQPGLPGVWISIRGSSILELWDPDTLICKMLYDTRAGRYPNLRKDDEVYFNKARITCILPLDYSVWVGTGEGNLITYDVFTHQGSKTPSDSSSFVGSFSDTFSALTSGKEETSGLEGEGYDPVREAAIKVRQLFLSQKDSDEEWSSHSLHVFSTSSTLVNSRNSVGQNLSDMNGATVSDVDAQDSIDISQVKVQESELGNVSSKDTQEETDPDSKNTEIISFTADFSHQNSFLESDSNTQSSSLNKATNFEQQMGNTNSAAGDLTYASYNTNNKDTQLVDTKNNLTNPKVDPSVCNRKNDFNKNLQDSVLSRNGVNKFLTKKNSLGEDEESTFSHHTVESNTQISDNRTKSNHTAEESPTINENKQNNQNSRNEDGKSSQSSISSQALHTNTANESVASQNRNLGKETSERLTSESGIEEASSDGSVIMQVWEGLKHIKSPQNDDHISVITNSCHQQTNSTKKKQLMMTSLGSSFASSVDSHHSESDEVFQDAKDHVTTDSPSTTTTVEDSQHETETKVAARRSVSSDDQRAPNSGARRSVSSDDQHAPNNGTEKPVRKKRRPQSLFLSKSFRSSVETGAPGNVEKKVSSVEGKVRKHPSPLKRISSMSKNNGENCGSASASGESIKSFEKDHQSWTSGASVDFSTMDNIAPDDREAQYRLDYTNLHVDTDVESICADESRRSSSIFNDFNHVHCQENILQEEDIVGGLGALDCDPSSFIFPQDCYNVGLNSRAELEALSQGLPDVCMSRFLHAPTFSTVSCNTWSSYDEIPTPSRTDVESIRSGLNMNCIGSNLPRNNSIMSTNSLCTSMASTAELFYAADMNLMSKNKISDKPVKCLLLLQFEGKPVVLSFSGCHSDDEAVLKWTREKDEMLWTNDPILEYNPTTKTTKLPMYMTARLSSTSSSQSQKVRLSSMDSQNSQNSQGSQ